VNLRVTWQGEVISVQAPSGATVGELRPLLAGHPDELWVATRLFEDHEPIGRIPNGSVLHGAREDGRPVPEVEGGRLDFHRPPRVAPAPVPPPVPLPELPQLPTRRVPFRWATATVPLIAGLVLALVFGPMMAAFSLLGVLMAVGSWLEERLALRRERRAARDTVRRALVHHRRATATQRKQVEAAVRSRLPDPNRVVEIATSMTRELWQRRPSHIDFGMVSVGRLPDGLPIRITLQPGTTVGIAGPAALGLARWIVVQAAVHHGPADVAVRGPSTPEWSWLDWLPHRPSGGQLDLVMDEIGGEQRCGIVVADGPDRLPGACGLVLVADEAQVKVTQTMHGEARSGRAVTIGMEMARGVARALACLRDPEAPLMQGSFSLDELLGLPTASSIADAWKHHDNGLVARLGTTREGALDLDLIGDGPHGLLAGTTGSGKSELLRTLVIALAARYPPERVAFVLVDFKGGATFDPCLRLPHVAGSMTDLDPSGARKMLEALEVELRAREEQLREAGVAALEPNDARMPRLLVAIDEFGVLADQAPAALDGLVDLARRGRSLGIHLLLATQRPAGVVSDRIRANTSIRIALRVHGSADSQDVVGADDAARIDRRMPGSGFVRLGPGELAGFTTAYVSGVSHEVRVSSSSRLVEKRQRSDLDRLVDAVCHAAGNAHADPVWSEEFPRSVRLGDLQPGEGIPIGLVDDPRHHGTLEWSGENVLVVDPAGDEAAGALAGVVTAACSHGTQVHIAGVRRDSPLWRLTSMAANVVGVGENERTLRLVQYLSEEIERRCAAGRSATRILLVTEELDVGKWLERVLIDGPAVGISTIAAIRHAGAVGGAILAAFSERLAFQLLDPYEYLALGIGSVPELPSGTAISMARRRAVRIVEPEYDIVAPPERAPRIDVLPRQVPVSTIRGRARNEDGLLLIPIGVGGTSTIGRLGFRVPRGRHIVITGPSGSGKSSALGAVAASVKGAVPVGSADGSGPRIVLIDDAHEIDTRPPGSDPDLHLVVAVRAGDLSHGHWVRRLAPDAVGLSLQPDHRDEEFWRMRLPGGQPPGRGVVLQRGVAVPIQVASGTMHPQTKEDQCEFG
jgi:S-DNA-T family DNA segregation ATPase FtsK/SpoIIIE